MSEKKTLNKEEFIAEVVKILKKCGLEEHARTGVVDIGILHDLLQGTKWEAMRDLFGEIEERFGGEKYRALVVDYDIWKAFEEEKLGKQEVSDERS